MSSVAFDKIVPFGQDFVLDDVRNHGARPAFIELKSYQVIF
jgi:hypothetical protein